MQRPADDCDAPPRARITPQRARAASSSVSATHDPWAASAPAGRDDRAPPVEPVLTTIWPFVCIVMLIVGLAVADYLLQETDAQTRFWLLVVRMFAGASLLALAGVTLRRLFIQRGELREALLASEERLVGSLSDLQKRKQVEALLFEEKERAQVTLASIADAVVTVDTAGRIEYMNPVAEHYTGWGASVARGRELAEVCHIVDEQTGQRVELALRGEGGSPGAPEHEAVGAALRLAETAAWAAAARSAAPSRSTPRARRSRSATASARAPS